MSEHPDKPGYYWVYRMQVGQRGVGIASPGKMEVQGEDSSFALKDIASHIQIETAVRGEVLKIDQGKIADEGEDEYE
jgi:hypothetical protein